MVAFSAVGPAGGAGAQATASPLTWTHPGTASDTYVAVGVAVDAGPDTGVTVTGVTFGGTPMVSVLRWQSGGAGQTAGFIHAWELFSPPTGSQTVSVTVTGTFTRISGGSISHTAASARSTAVHSDSAATSVTTGSLGVPTTSASNVAVCFITDGTSPIAFTAGTQRFASTGATQINAANNVGGATATGTGGTVTFTWTQGADYFGAVGFEVQGGAAGPAPSPVTPRQAFRRYRTRQGHRPWQQTQSPPAPLPPAVYGIAGSSAAVAVAAGSVSIPGSATYITQILGSGAASYFADSSGNPRFLFADNPWSLLPNAGRWAGTYQIDIDTYCNNRGNQGFTAIYLDPLSNLLNNGPFADGRLYNGGSTTTWPFTVNGSAASTASLAGTETLALNNAFWAIVDYFITACARNNMVAMLNIAYAGPGDFASGGAYGSASITTTQFQQIGAALAARYASTQNIIWLVGNDYQGGIGGTLGSGGGTASAFDNFFTALRTGLRGGGDSHPISIHMLHEMDSRQDLQLTVGGSRVQYWGNNFADFNGNYTYNAPYLGIESAYGETSPILVMQLDGYFYQNGGGGGYWAPYDRAFRQDAWWAIASAARGVSQGADNIWQWASNSLSDSGADWFYIHNAAAFRPLVESLSGWHTLTPDISSTMVTGGRGTRLAAINRGDLQYESSFANSWVAASRSPDAGSGSSLGLLYLPNATTITIHTGSGGMLSGYTGTWYDPVTGTSSSAGSGPTFNSTAKGNNSQGDPDWVLVLRGPAGVTYPLAGSAPSASSASGSISDTGVITGTAPSASSASGAIVQIGVISGSAPATSVATGALTATGVIAGSSAAVSVATGAIVRIGVIAGSSTAASTATGAITATLVLAGSSASASAAQGVLGTLGIVSGSAAPASSATGAVVIQAGAVTYPVAGSSAGASSATGAIVLAGVITGSSASVSSASGAIVQAMVLTGSSATSSSAAGTIAQTGVIAGSSATASSATGSMSRVTPVAGSSATGSGGTGAVTITSGPQTYIITGSSSPVSAATGTLGMTGAIAGSSATVSSAAGTITATIVIAGSSTTQSSASGSIGLRGLLAGLSVTTSLSAGSVALAGVVTGASQTVSSATGVISALSPLAGSSPTVSSATGAVTIVSVPALIISGSSASISSATGAIVRTGALSGTAASVSSASGTLAATQAISGISLAISSASGSLTLRAIISGRADAASLATGWMSTAFRLSGLSATVSRADGSVNPPFIAGGLPPVLTAIVYVSDEVSSQVSVDGLSATIETNKMNVEVT